MHLTPRDWADDRLQQAQSRHASAVLALRLVRFSFGYQAWHTAAFYPTAHIGYWRDNGSIVPDRRQPDSQRQRAYLDNANEFV